MTAPTVRADYAQLLAAARQFGEQAQATQQSLRGLQRDLDALQGGDWLGTGATAFYQEMGSQVMPTLRRLAAALQTAQTTTLQIREIAAQAEAEAARWLRGEGQAAGLAGLPGRSMPAPASSPAGASAASAVDNGAAGAGTPTVVAIREHTASVVNQMLNDMADTAAALGFDRDKVAAAMGQVVEDGLRGEPLLVQDTIMRPLQEQAVDRKLAHFSEGVRTMVKQSPTLRAQIFRMEQFNTNIVIGPAGQGSGYDEPGRLITIAEQANDAHTVGTLAHEAGHVMSNQPSFLHPLPTDTRASFIEENVKVRMLDEGDAQFNAAKVRAEIIAAGGADIGIGGTQPDAYLAIYDKFAAGDLRRFEAVQQMGDLMKNEHTSSPPHNPYLDYYSKDYEDYWDTNVAPTRATP